MPVAGMPCGFFSARTPPVRQTISEQVRAGGSFALAWQVAESASSLERLVAFTGRPVDV